MTKCGKCKADMTEENSTPATRARPGRPCIPCSKEIAKLRRTQRPLAHILYRVKGNAKIRGIEFNVTEKDLPPIPKYCPILPWLELVYAVGEGRSPASLSLDRIDSSKGYVKGNLRFVSDRANRMKSDMTDQELIMLGKDAETRISK